MALDDEWGNAGHLVCSIPFEIHFFLLCPCSVCWIKRTAVGPVMLWLFILTDLDYFNYIGILNSVVFMVKTVFDCCFLQKVILSLS